MTETSIPLTVEFPHILTVREVSQALRCSRSQAYNLIYAGAIPTMKVAGKTICRAKDVLEYLQKCEMDSGLVGNAAEPLKPSDTAPTEVESAVLSAHRRSKRLMVS
jgi:excisionase family DNA binding protein